MKNISKFVFMLLFLVSFQVCNGQHTSSKQQINIVLNHWHKAAANANFDDYFGCMTNDAVFIGTDATENWNLPEFKSFCAPYFKAGKAWRFTPMERNIYVSGNIAWFDELLNTQMKICRGSGVLVKQNGVWKIKHYVLSMTIPNETASKVIKIKDSIENILIHKIR